MSCAIVVHTGALYLSVAKKDERFGLGRFGSGLGPAGRRTRPRDPDLWLFLCLVVCFVCLFACLLVGLFVFLSACSRVRLFDCVCVCEISI